MVKFLYIFPTLLKLCIKIVNTLTSGTLAGFSIKDIVFAVQFLEINCQCIQNPKFVIFI